MRLCLCSAAIFAAACGGSAPVTPSSSPSPTPTPVVAEPAGSYVYVAERTRKTISGFNAGRLTGAFTPLASSTVALSGEPFALATDAQARFVYVGMSGGPDALATYAVDRRTGSLSAVPSSGRPAPNVTGEHGPLYPSAILLHPSGRLAYVTFSYVTTECADDTLIYVYAVDPASGMLTKLGLAPQSVGQGWGAASVVLSASGARLYSASGGDFENNVCTVAPGMRGFAVDAGSGELRELAGSPFAQGTRDDGYSWLGLRPTGDFLYLAHQSGTSWFKVNAATGAVMNQGMASYSLPGVAAFSPSGRLYSAAAESLTWGVRAFDVQPDTGALSPIRGAPFATPSYVKAIAIDSTGRFLFAAQPWGGVISAFAIDAGTGSLTPVPGSPAAMGTELSDDVAIVIVNVP